MVPDYNRNGDVDIGDFYIHEEIINKLDEHGEEFPSVYYKPARKLKSGYNGKKQDR